MRPVFPSDLDAVTHVLLASQPTERAALARSIMARANTADRYRKRLGRCHPTFGSGTLTSAIPTQLQPAHPAFCTTAYLRALSLLIDALCAQKNDQIR